MSNPDTLTSLAALLPNPTATIVAIIDDQYLFVDCSQRPHFADWIVTPAHMNHLPPHTGFVN